MPGSEQAVAALSMQAISAKKKAVTKETLSGAKKSTLGALTGYEVRSARRNPAYLIYGFVMSFVWPVLMPVRIPRFRLASELHVSQQRFGKLKMYNENENRFKSVNGT